MNAASVRRPRRPGPAVVLAGALAGASLAHAGGEPQRARPTPAPHEWIISMWAGLAGADSSESTSRQVGVAATGSSGDFGAFILLGARAELFPSTAGSTARHFGLGIEINGLAGEADMETQPGFGVEEVTLTAAVVTPSLMLRLPGRSWEGYGGVGATVLWASRLSDVGGVFFSDDDTDVEAPLGLALFAGVRRTYAGGWFIMLEARHHAGENDFTLREPLTEVHLDWRTTQFAVGSGFRF